MRGAIHHGLEEPFGEVVTRRDRGGKKTAQFQQAGVRTFFDDLVKPLSQR